MSASSTSIDDICKLAPVHHLILHHLTELIPAKLLRLNTSYFNSLLPRIYESISLNKNNVGAVLYGLRDAFELGSDGIVREKEGQFKVTALKHVKNLHFADWYAEWGICENRPAIEGLDDDYESRTRIPMILPGVKHVHFDSQIISQSAVFAQNMYSYCGVGPIGSTFELLMDDIHDTFSLIFSAATWAIEMPHTVSPLDCPLEGLLDYLDSAWFIKHPTEQFLVDMDDVNPRIPVINDYYSVSRRERETGDYFVRINVPHTDSTEQDMQDGYDRAARTIWRHYIDEYDSRFSLVPTILVADPERLIAAIREVRPTETFPAYTTDVDLDQVQELVQLDTEMQSRFCCPAAKVKKSAQIETGKQTDVVLLNDRKDGEE